MQHSIDQHSPSEPVLQRQNTRVICNGLALSIAVLLSACSGAPSESDMKSALKSTMDQERAAAERVMGKSGASMFAAMMPEIKDVKKIGCKDDGENAYRCDLELVTLMQGSETKQATSMRFVKTSSGWSALRR